MFHFYISETMNSLDVWLRCVLTTAMVGVAVWSSVWIPIVMAHHPSVYYINHPVRGDYLMARDKGIETKKFNTMDIITHNVCKLDLTK